MGKNRYQFNFQQWNDMSNGQRMLAYARLLTKVAALESALQRTASNFSLSVQGKPVRDMTETLAEIEQALALKI